MKKYILFIILAVIQGLTITETYAANVLFENVTVRLIETRSDAWGSWLIITLNDSSGNRVLKLCDTANDKAAIAVSLSDSSAKPIMALAITAKTTGKTVIGWGIDPPQSQNWCGIGNFAIP